LGVMGHIMDIIDIMGIDVIGIEGAVLVIHKVYL
jgi:hypothetical protein